MRWAGMLMLLGACGGLEVYDVVPEEGAWSLAITERASNDCGWESPPAESGLIPLPDTIWLESDDAGDLWMSFDGASEDGRCEAFGDTLDCRPAVRWERQSEAATVSFALQLTGVFQSRAHLRDGSFLAEYRCRGDGCWDHQVRSNVQRLPCQQSGGFEAQRSEGVLGPS